MGKAKNKNKHWIVLAVCCGLAASSIGISINSSGVFYMPVAESLGIMRGTFSMHMTIFSFVTALSALFVPIIMKKIAFKPLLIVSVGVAVVSTALMGAVNTVPMFYLLGAIRGLSTSMFSIVPLTMIINQWFIKKHGFATSLVFGFSGLAGSLCSPILSACIENFGWQTGYLIKALIILVICLPAILYPFQVNPHDEGLKAYGHIMNQEQTTTTKKTSKVNLLTAGFIGFFILGIFVSAITGLTQHFPGFAESIGYTTTLGASMLSAGMIGNIVSKLVIGVMSDRFGAVLASVAMLGMNLLGIVLLIVGSSQWLLLAGAFLFGSIYSVGAVGLPLLTKYCFGVENYGRVFPGISFASNLGAAVSLSIIGYIYDFTGSYTSALWLGIGICITCFLLIFVVHQKTKGKYSS